MEDILALSLLPSSLQREYLNESHSARELVRYSNEHSIAIQPHLRAHYGSDASCAAKKILQKCDKQGFEILTIESQRYPRTLSQIADPPLAVYTKGGDIASKTVSVVGTRNSDALSESVTARLCSDMCAAGYTIVSGMASGIDRIAHLTAINCNSATVGVCANGIDCVYPRSNSDLFEKCGHGLVLLSEHPPMIRAGKWAFARRNRIISGLSGKCVVVKASRRSGAMITARFAVEQGRDLFVCPGYSFDPEYEGCLCLINSGALAIFDTSTILEDEMKNLSEATQVSLFNETDNNREPADITNEIYPFVRDGCRTVDELVLKTGKKPSEVLALIMRLSLSGVAELVGDSVRLCRVRN